MDGYIHSIESFGTVDGPGIRMVVFFQGCPMRCLYCHNPDTWSINTGQRMSAETILDEYEKNRDFYTTGGITATGGEPMLQMEFLTELFTKAKQKGIHTCLDTCGINYSDSNPDVPNKTDRLLSVTDLIMLDIKHIDPVRHKSLTGQDNKKILKFLARLNQKQKSVWIRHVIVPGLTDDPAWLQKLGYEIGAYHCIKALDVLPYHSMGQSKYKQLNLDYPLAGTPDATQQQALQAKQYILSGIRLRRQT